MQSPYMQSPSEYYDTLVANGDIQNDDCQRNALVHMDALYGKLLQYSPPKQGIFSRFFKKNPPVSPPKGLYTHGTVGTGKTVLLKCFFKTAPTDKKAYFHLHHFLSDVNQRLNTFAHHHLDEADIMAQVIESYIHTAWLFCFDECVVGDVADAMLFGQISTGIISRGGVIVCTSNFAPDKLRPRGGVGNNVFQRYAKQFFAHMIAHDMNSPTDYRVIEGADNWRFYWNTSTNPTAESELNGLLAEKTTGDWYMDSVAVRDRRISIPKCNNKVCLFDFCYIIGGAFGAEDFMAIASKYPIVVIKNITPISADNTSLIKRLIVFIDCLYENKARLIITANCDPEQIYPKGLVSFEFARALSRLNAMQAIGYSRA